MFKGGKRHKKKNKGCNVNKKNKELLTELEKQRLLSKLKLNTNKFIKIC